jgi:kinetochore protein Nuf2
LYLLVMLPAYNATQMAEHLRQNEDEVTNLLAEYWRLRHQTGKCNAFDLTTAYFGSSQEVYMETLANKLGLDLEEVHTT